MPTLKALYSAHSDYQDSLLAQFELHLRVMVMRVQTRVTSILYDQLSITGGIIDQTPGNIRALRNFNNLLMREMDRAGLKRLLQSFVDQFRGQLPYLHDVLRLLSSEMQTPLKWTATKADADVLGSFQANAVSSIETAIEQAAGATMTRSMFMVGGLKFGDLVETIAKTFEQSIGKARTIADTSMSVFYATASDRAFQAIERSQSQPLKYRYSGPTDLLERPFCRHLTMVDKAYTREQIAKMDNGQLPNVFISRGGWNCRHQWNLDTSELEVQAVEAA